MRNFTAYLHGKVIMRDKVTNQNQKVGANFYVYGSGRVIKREKQLKTQTGKDKLMNLGHK